jgi:hypothetical protein
MAGFSWAAAASIAAGLMIGAAATVGATLEIEDHKSAPAQTVRNAPGPYLVSYGSRCWRGHCIPWP